ncbi:autotransporter outer membrane beta-barrel domain-containing protein [Phascolarctobacterium succinatutens]
MMKSSRALARKILCGLLAAGVVGVSGSALAAPHVFYTGNSYNYSASKTVKSDIKAEQKDDVSAQYAGVQIILKRWKGSSVNVKLQKNIDIDIVNTGSNTNPNDGLTAGIYSASYDSLKSSKVTSTLGTKNTTNTNIKAQGKQTVFGIFLAGQEGFNGPQMTINGKNLNIDAVSDSYYAYGINVSNYTTPATIGGKDASKLIINSENTVINATSNSSDKSDSHSIGIAAYSQGQVEFNGNLKVDAETAICTRGNSQITINKDGNHVIQLNGDVKFDYDAATSGTTSDADVNINLDNAESYLNGSVSIDGNPPAGKDVVTGMNMKISNDAAWNMTGDSFVNNAEVRDGGSINVQESVSKFDAGNLKLDNANLNLQGNNQNVTVDDLQGNSGKITTNSLNNHVTIGEDKTSNLTVNGTKEVTDAIASGNADLQDLADVVKSNGKSAADTVTSDANDILGGYQADVDEHGDVIKKSAKTLENPTNRAISDMANISLMTWRQENNDMNKRLGELRDSKGEHGAWARMARGESKYGSQNVKNQYNYYQVGYDEKLSTNPNWTVGVALTRTEGSSTFARGTGENKHTGLAVYGSYVNDNGSFIDLIAKYARMDNDYKTIGIGVGDASYESNGYSLSAEYGKRFTKDNGFWIEPQVELTYGTVGSVDYLTSKGARVHQDSVDSLVGRLGFSLGKDIKQGNVYVRASYLYDFDGETSATMVGKGSQKYEQGLGGGWWEVGVGTNLNLSDATHLYFDVEKTYGGNVATPWQWNAGVRWSF